MNNSIDIQEIVEKLTVALENTSEPLSEFFNSDTKELIRTPVEIKKEIKREKNPMRLKQLNKELNDSYKAFRRRK